MSISATSNSPCHFYACVCCYSDFIHAATTTSDITITAALLTLALTNLYNCCNQYTNRWSGGPIRGGLSCAMASPHSRGLQSAALMGTALLNLRPGGEGLVSGTTNLVRPLCWHVLATLCAGDTPLFFMQLSDFDGYILSRFLFWLLLLRISASA
jgi:hypothetical protein